MSIADKFFYATITLVLFLIATVIFNIATASGKVDYCYVYSYTKTQTNTPDEILYNLYGHRSWREDRLISEANDSFDAAVFKAKTMDCEVR